MRFDPVRFIAKVGARMVERTYHSEQTVVASASQVVGTSNTAGLQFDTRKAVLFFIDVTNVGAAGTVTYNLQVQDPVVTANWITVKTTGALATVAQRLILVFPGATSADTATLFYANLASPGNGRIRLQSVVAVNAVTHSVSSVELEFG